MLYSESASVLMIYNLTLPITTRAWPTYRPNFSSSSMHVSEYTVWPTASKFGHVTRGEGVFLYWSATPVPRAGIQQFQFLWSYVPTVSARKTKFGREPDVRKRRIFLWSTYAPSKGLGPIAPKFVVPQLTPTSYDMERPNFARWPNKRQVTFYRLHYSPRS